MITGRSNDSVRKKAKRLGLSKNMNPSDKVTTNLRRQFDDSRAKKLFKSL